MLIHLRRHSQRALAALVVLCLLSGSVAAATRTNVAATANNGAVSLEYDYDDVTLLISTIRLTNNGTFGKVTVAFLDRTTGTPVWGPTTRGFGTGTLTQDVSGLGIHMITVTGRFGPGLSAPFNTSLEWASQ